MRWTPHVLTALAALSVSVNGASLPQNIASNSSLWDHVSDSRDPQFKDVVYEGWRHALIAAQKAQKIQVSVNRPIRKVVNWTPGLRTSSDVSDFLFINLTVILDKPSDYLVKVGNDASLWNTWQDVLVDKAVPISREISHLGFSTKMYSANEDQARAALVRSGIRGPWNVIQLCGLMQRQQLKLFYAFGAVESSQDFDTTWNLVNARSGSIQFYKGDPCSDSAPRPAIESNNGNFTSMYATPDLALVS